MSEESTQEPVAWCVRDYGDGWIIYRSEEEARRYASETGALMKPLYTHPAPRREVTVEEVARLREALRDAEKAMTCGADDDDSCHYCPNCDTTSRAARNKVRKALAETGGEV